MKKTNKYISWLLSVVLLVSTFVGIASFPVSAVEGQTVYFQFPDESVWNHEGLKITARTRKANVYCYAHAIYGNTYDYKLGWKTRATQCSAMGSTTTEIVNSTLFSFDLAAVSDTQPIETGADYGIVFSTAAIGQNQTCELTMTTDCIGDTIVVTPYTDPATGDVLTTRENAENSNEVDYYAAWEHHENYGPKIEVSSTGKILPGLYPKKQPKAQILSNAFREHLTNSEKNQFFGFDNNMTLCSKLDVTPKDVYFQYIKDNVDYFNGEAEIDADTPCPYFRYTFINKQLQEEEGKLASPEYVKEVLGLSDEDVSSEPSTTSSFIQETTITVEPTTEEPTTEEPTTEEPTTEEPTTEEPTTEEPTTEEPTTEEPTTEEPTTEESTTEESTTEEPTTEELTTEPPVDHTYTVAGSSAAMFGLTWDATNTANDMVKGDDGIWTITYPNVQPADAIQLKVVEDHSWDNAWGDKETGDNYTFNVVTACDVTVTFNRETEKVNVTGDGVTQDTELDVYSVIAVGNGEDTYLNGANWDPSDTANAMEEVADGIWEMTMENVYAFDNYNIKFAINSIDADGKPTSNPWAHNFGSAVEQFYPTSRTIDAVYNGKNCIFEVEEDGSTVKLQLDLRKFDYYTKQGAEFKITVTPPGMEFPTEETTTSSEPYTTYSVAGSATTMFGTLWDATNTANDMKFNSSTGRYEIIYIDVQPIDEVQFKVVKDHNWDESYPIDKNYTFNVESTCNVKVTYNPQNNKINVYGNGVTKDEDFVIERVERVIAFGNGEDTYLNGANWDPSDTANSMEEVADGVWELTMEDVYAFDNYNIKFAINSVDADGDPKSNPWAHTFGSTVEQVYPTGRTIDAVYNGKTCIFEVEEDGSKVKLQLDLRKFDFNTKQGAKFKITVVPPGVEFPTEEPTEEPITIEPITVNPTEAPTTVEPTTDEPTVFEPTEEPTIIETTTVEPTTNGPTIVSRGTTGNCTWMLDDEGTLTISGNGAMGDYSYTSLNATNSTYITTAPWGTNIKNLVIESGVTNIGKSAFCGCTDLTNIDIPDSVTSIGNYAFLYCASLTSVDIPDSVKSIGVYAFYDCTDLTSVTIPDSVESIGSAAFDCCAKLIIYCNPGSYAESYANKNGRRTNITGECTWTLDANGTLTISGNGAMADYASINDNGNSITIHSRPWGTDIKRLIIENGVTNVGSGSIRNCTSLTSVAIPNSVTSIGLEAFSYCTGLTSISIPDNVTSIGRSAFSNCYGLTSVIIGNSVTNIGDNAFYNCNNLVIYGKENSYAQTYAQNNKITFVTIKECLQCHSLLTDDMIITDEGYPATCTQAGLTDGSRCSICGEIMVGQEVIPAKGHNETVQKGYPATCTETGLTDGSYCSECGLIFTAQEVIPATGHSPVIDPKVDPTCSHDGLTTGSHCENCGLVYVPQKVIARLEHTIVTDPAIEPDCIHTGLTEGSHCSACGEVFVEQQVVPALGHSYVMVDSVPATHFRTGFTDGVVCERCGEWLIEQEIVPKLDGDVPIGDINDDGTVDILDATVVQKYASGKSDLTPEQIAVADVNNDGVADILDTAEIQKFAAGKITEFKKKT